MSQHSCLLISHSRCIHGNNLPSFCSAMPPKTLNAAEQNCSCGCDCHLDEGGARKELTPCHVDDGMVQCDCLLCGGGRCKNHVSPLLKLAVIQDRGIRPQNLQSWDATPCYCGECRHENLLEIRRQAVRRARENRKAASKTQADSKTQPEGTRSRSPKRDRPQT